MGATTQKGEHLMFYIDDAKLVDEAINTDGVYHVDVPNKILSIFVNSVEVHSVIFIDVNRGFLIKNQTDITGKLVICNGEPLKEFCFGEITLKFQ